MNKTQAKSEYTRITDLDLFDDVQITSDGKAHGIRINDDKYGMQGDYFSYHTTSTILTAEWVRDANAS